MAEILFTFSKADRIVKQHFTPAVIKETLCILKKQSNQDILLLLLKVYRNLTVEDSLVQSFVDEEESIRTLVNVLGDKKLTQTHIHYLLHSLSHICSFDAKSRTIAAQCGIIPHLKASVEEAIEKKNGGVSHVTQQTPRDNAKQPIEYILPIMFEFTRTKSVYPLLLQNDCVNFYLSLFELGFPYPAQAVDALANWLEWSGDKKVVEELSKPVNMQKLVALFKTAETETFESIIEPVLKISQFSKKMVNALITEEFVPVLLQHFVNEKPLVRVNLVKILNSLYIGAKKQKQLITKYKLVGVVENLEKDSSVIVVEMATRLKQLMHDAK